MDNILLSVIMPVYNGEEFLAAAIESILNQTYTNFEFIIVNDGSTDSSQKIIENYVSKDERIILISRANRGLVSTLNEAITKSRGVYLARMDADDISLPTRFQEQVSYLNKHNNVDVVGCDYEHIDSQGVVKRLVRVPKTEDEILLTLFFTVPFAHPSIMGRKVAFSQVMYEESPIEDYLLWTKMYKAGKFSNIDKVLFNYRHDYGGSFSDTKRILMMKSEAVIINKFCHDFIEGCEKASKTNVNVKILGRAVANVAIYYSVVKGLKLVIKRPNVLLSTLFFISRHIARSLYWQLKSSK